MATFTSLSVVTKSPNFKTATKLVKVPLVEPAPTEIRIRQIYSGLNAYDMKATAARHYTGTLPFGIGYEALGIVDAVGSDVPVGKFTIGQSVLVFDHVNSTGFSEYSYKPVENVFPIPALNPEYMVACINGLTASIGLDTCGRIQPGDKVLITAAAGGTGQIAVQWAKHRGGYVIALTSSVQKAEYLKELGADLVINYREENLDQVLTDKFPNGIDVIWETIGGETFRTLFNHLAQRGRLVLIGSVSTYEDGSPCPVIENLNAQLVNGAKTLAAFHLFLYLDRMPEYMKKLIGGIEQKKLKVQVDLGERAPSGMFLGIENVHKAQEWLHSGKNMGKVVVQLQNV